MLCKDFKEVERSCNQRFDLCLIGGGLMTYILLEELKNTDLQICIIESGDNEKAESLKEVISGSLKIRNQSRVRGFGGSTATWWGLSGMLDGLDMNDAACNLKKWPLTIHELRAYLQQAGLKYGFPAIESYEQAVKESPDILSANANLKAELFSAKIPVMRCKKMYDSLFEKENYIFITNAAVSKLESDSGTEISAAEVIVGNEKIRIKAEKFVLAAGGIENARLLLNSPVTKPGSAGNKCDCVGKYFMNHPKGFAGEVVLKSDVSKSFEDFFVQEDGSYRWYLGIGLTESFRREHRMAHHYTQLVPMYPWTGNSLFTKFISLKNFYKKQNSVSNQEDVSLDISTRKNHFSEYISVFWLVLLYAQMKFFNKKPKIERFKFRNYLEVEPRAENAVTLSKKLDCNGVPLPVVSYDLSQNEKNSLIKLHLEIKSIFSGSEFEYVEPSYDPWTVVSDGAHHMGATRMGEDPRFSVVDAHQKVHGISNLFIAGTSVMPTGGNINPTFVAAGLTIRLAEHIRSL